MNFLTEDNSKVNIEITVKLNHYHYLHPPNITARSLSTPFITTEIVYKYDRYTKRLKFI